MTSSDEHIWAGHAQYKRNGATHPNDCTNRPHVHAIIAPPSPAGCTNHLVVHAMIAIVSTSSPCQGVPSEIYLLPIAHQISS